MTVLPDWNALQYAQRLGGIVTTKEPHYRCKACPEVIFKLGGFSVAAQHFKTKHPGEKFDVRIEMRWPK